MLSEPWPRPVVRRVDAHGVQKGTGQAPWFPGRRIPAWEHDLGEPGQPLVHRLRCVHQQGLAAPDGGRQSPRPVPSQGQTDGWTLVAVFGQHCVDVGVVVLQGQTGESRRACEVRAQEVRMQVVDHSHGIDLQDVGQMGADLPEEGERLEVLEVADVLRDKGLFAFGSGTGCS